MEGKSPKIISYYVIWLNFIFHNVVDGVNISF